MITVYSCLKLAYVLVVQALIPKRYALTSKPSTSERAGERRQQLMSQSAFKQLRDALRRLHPTVFTTEKMLKSLRFTFNDKVLNEHMKTKRQNFGIVEGSVVLAVSPTGDGNDGGRRSCGNADKAEDKKDDDDNDDKPSAEP